MKYFHTSLQNDNWKGVVEIKPTFGHIKGMCIPYADFPSQKGFLDGKAGIYFYIWIDPSTGHIQKCYIGETENLAVRPLQKHGNMTLDWHFLAVFFREHDTERYFDTDSRQYMEQSLIDRFPYPDILLNGNAGHKSKKRVLTDEKHEVSSVLIDEIVAMAPALCFGLFIDFRSLTPAQAEPQPDPLPQPEKSTPPETVTPPPEVVKPDPEKTTPPPKVVPPGILYFYIKDENRDIDATMYQRSDGKIIVLKGSRISRNDLLPGQKGQMGTHKKRVAYETDGTIVDRVFTRDVVFGSSSGSASLIRGTASSGYEYWITDDGTTFGEWSKSSTPTDA